MMDDGPQVESEDRHGEKEREESGVVEEEPGAEGIITKGLGWRINEGRQTGWALLRKQIPVTVTGHV